MKNKNTPLLIVLIIAMITLLACSLGEAVLENAASSLSLYQNSPTSQATVTAPAIAIQPRLFICTGSAQGSLWVRGCAGVICKETALLRENVAVNVVDEATALDGGLWYQIASPVNGWINSRYTCQEINR